MRKELRFVLEFLKVCVIAIIISTLISTQILAVSQVRQSSMEKTLFDGNILFVEKVSYHFVNPKPGDIIIINMVNTEDSFVGRIKTLYSDMLKKISREDNKDRMVKRVIGIEGQKIDIINGFVYVNDEQIDEGYVTSLTQPKYNSSVVFPLIVPQGEVFVLGDNREVSEDSRFYNCIKLNQIEGKMFFKLF